MSEIEQFLDGTGIYKETIDSLRKFINSIEAIDKSDGGALIFFTGKNPEKNDLNIRIFPLNKNRVLLKNKHLSAEEKKNIFALLNQEQSYQNSWHFKEFIDRYKDERHFSTHIRSHNVITYTDDDITVDKKNYSWKAFYEELSVKKISKHVYEQLMFESGCNQLTYIPLPVLSTPFVLLVLSSNKHHGSLSELLKALYFRSRDTVSKHLYSRLILKITEYINTDIKQITEIDLVQKFVEEICNIILPISYKINIKENGILKEGQVVQFYTLWPSKNIDSKYTLQLLEKYSIEFRLTSFAFTDFEHNDSGEWPLFHQSKIFDATLSQSSALIGRLFDLFHKNWELLRHAEKLVYQRIYEAVEQVNINHLVDMVTDIRNEFTNIKTVAKELDDSPYNKLEVDDEKVVLTMKRMKLLSITNPQQVGKIAGFKYLQFMFRQSKENNNRFSINYIQLYNAVTPDRVQMNDELMEHKKRIARFDAADPVKFIANFLNQYKDIIPKIKEAPSNDDSFNEEFYFSAGLALAIQDTKAGIYTDEHRENFTRSGLLKGELKRLIKLYHKEDKEFAKKLKEQDRFIRAYLVDHHDTRYLLNDYEAAKVQGAVRSGVAAAIKEIMQAHAHELEDNEKKRQLRRLLDNLEEAGLKKKKEKNTDKDSDQPQSQVFYQYNQDKLKNPIVWEFE